MQRLSHFEFSKLLEDLLRVTFEYEDPFRRFINDDRQKPRGLHTLGNSLMMDSLEAPLYFLDCGEFEKVMMVWKTSPENIRFQGDRCISTNNIASPNIHEISEPNRPTASDQPDLGIDTLDNLPSDIVPPLSACFRNRGTSSRRLQTITGSNKDISSHATTATSVAENTYAEYSELPSFTNDQIITRRNSTSPYDLSSGSPQQTDDDFDRIYHNHDTRRRDDKFLSRISKCNSVIAIRKPAFETEKNNSPYRRMQYASNHLSLPSFSKYRREKRKIQKQSNRIKKPAPFIAMCKNSVVLQFVTMFAVLIACILFTA